MRCLEASRTVIICGKNGHNGWICHRKGGKGEGGVRKGEGMGVMGRMGIMGAMILCPSRPLCPLRL